MVFARISLFTAHGSRLTARRSLLTALLLTALSSPLFAATPGLDTLVNYDTAWTYVYDGGTTGDIFYDVKCLTDGMCVCVGETGDTSNNMLKTMLMKFDASGKILQKKFYQTQFPNNNRNNNQYAHSIAIAKNGDFIIGGVRNLGPYVMRTDSSGNLKWATWYYDSLKDKSLFKGKGVINSIQETKNGNIIAAIGDPYPFNDGQPLTNYAAYLAYDSAGTIQQGNEWDEITGYTIGGFYIEQTATGYYLLSGNQAVFYMDSIGTTVWKKGYSFDLNGVGTVSNNVARAKMLRDNSLMVAGQAYEGNCWTMYKKLYYDAWWSPISYAYGPNSAWDTAGYQGGDDAIYDFTQLKNGNIVFVGLKQYLEGPHKIWIFVTDSTGKKMLLDKEYIVTSSAPNPMAVCATPDDGFTVVGGMVGDAFIAHFVPKPVSAVVSPNQSIIKSAIGFDVHLAGAKLVVANTSTFKNIGEAALFDVTGRQIAAQKGKKEMVFDISKLARGTYFVRMKTESAEQTIKIFLAR